MDLQTQEIHQHQELVKCVVVGDTAVGKTRLICARALDSKLQLNQLISTHIPTVWAIDQYRIHKQVLERSCEVVDGVNVSLRLWDTFGDHDKDRRFAYGRSDVVLLCFSIANPNSLRNCKSVWYPEIRKFCPNTPVVLIGCKNDLRYMYNNEQYLNLCKEKSPFYRQLKESDILTPEHGRKVAEELGIPYYECSVFTPFGIDVVFQNVIRTALLHRRQQRFWYNHLKSIQKPTLQAPHCPERPPAPEIFVTQSSVRQQIAALHDQKLFHDVHLLTTNSDESKKERSIPAHRVLLCAASPLFGRLFRGLIASQSKNNVINVPDPPVDPSEPLQLDLFDENNDSIDLSLDSDCKPVVRSPSVAAMNAMNTINDNFYQRKQTPQRQQKFIEAGESIQFEHPAVRSLQLLVPVADKCGDHLIESGWSDNITRCLNSRPVFQVELSEEITEKALQECVHFIYTGELSEARVPIDQLKQAAELLEISSLIELLQLSAVSDRSTSESIYASITYRNLQNDLTGKHLQQSLKQMHESAEQGEFTDINFQLDDGIARCHKPILIVRCEMMGAMFCQDFRESSLRIVRLPGVDRVTFEQFLQYVYLDELPVPKQQDSSKEIDELSVERASRLLELANRLCLTRLVQLVESQLIAKLTEMTLLDSLHHSLKLLEHCQMHNADQLADWCLFWISVNYSEASSKLMRLLRSLHPENQAYLNKNRWPPVWYIKEREHYERCLRERSWSERKSGSIKCGIKTSSTIKTKSLRLRKRALCCLFFRRGKVSYAPM